MNLERISEALQNYTGQEDSMHQVAAVLQEELGENWTQTVFQDLQGLSPALKENLNHAFNYYAATMAWNEVQSYLADENLSRTPEVEERLPILKHWLDFFGAPGVEAYKALETRLQELPEEQQDSFVDEENGDIDTESEVSDDVVNAMSEDELESIENQELDPNQEVVDIPEDDSNKQPIDDQPNIESEEAEMPQQEPVDDQVVFAFEKLKKQLDLLTQNQAWLSARCVQLKNIEVYAYPFYGFIVDLLRQVLKDMNAILENENLVLFIATQFDGGRQAFENRKAAIEHDIELAEQNCESAVTALISDDVDMEEIKRTLGTIDDSDSVEYVGPAPDGFELLDDETPLDENAIKKQYEKIENMDALGGHQESEPEKNDLMQENTSQNTQKGVQRKLSFSLKRQKPTGDET